MQRLLLLVLFTAVAAGRADAQSRTAVAPDSTTRRCMAVTWLNAEMICEGRALNTVTGGVLGGLAGMTMGYAGGLIAPTQCIGNAEAAAVRGGIAGAAIGTVGALVARQISRRELAERNAREKEEALAHPNKPWSLRDLRPALEFTGAMATVGAGIGATQGSRYPAKCGGVGGGALRGAEVYGVGPLATIAGGMLVVRFLF